MVDHQDDLHEVGFLAANAAKQAIQQEYIRDLENANRELDQQIIQAIQTLKNYINFNLRESMTLLHSQLLPEVAQWAEDRYGRLVNSQFRDKFTEDGAYLPETSKLEPHQYYLVKRSFLS